VRTREGENRREKKEGCFPLAQTRPEIREKEKERGLFCPASRERVSERETELERERAVAFPAYSLGNLLTLLDCDFGDFIMDRTCLGLVLITCLK
jgi:hypothetical protein